MYLYHKDNETQNFPINLISKKNNQYSNYNNIFKPNNYIKYNENTNKSNNINTSINNKTNQFNNNHNINSNYIYNSINTHNSSNSHIIKNNFKIMDIKRKNQNSNHINNSNKSSNPINTFIINTLNVTEKEFLGKRISTSNPQKYSTYIKNKNYHNELNKLKKETDESQNIVKKQKKLIEKLEEDNQKLENEIKKIYNENKKIKQKIEINQENQEQLIMLVKIVQKSGINVEEMIDKWNEEVEMENNNSKIINKSNDSKNNESLTDSYNELNSNIDPSSFIPINIEKPQINKKVFNGIPKLNFEILKNNKRNNKKAKFRNNSK